MVQDILLGRDGSIWLMRRGDDLVTSRVVRFDPTGALEGVLPEGFPMPLAILPDGLLIVRVVDDFDVERLGIVRLVS